MPPVVPVKMGRTKQARRANPPPPADASSRVAPAFTATNRRRRPSTGAVCVRPSKDCAFTRTCRPPAANALADRRNRRRFRHRRHRWCRRNLGTSARFRFRTSPIPKTGTGRDARRATSARNSKNAAGNASGASAKGFRSGPASARNASPATGRRTHRQRRRRHPKPPPKSPFPPRRRRRR